MKLNEFILDTFVKSQLPPKPPPKKIHQIIFSTGCISISLIGSAYFYASDNAEYFARFGSIILALAFFQITLSREEFQDSKLNWDRHRAFTHINETKQQISHMGEALDLTFDIKSAEIEQLYRETEARRILAHGQEDFRVFLESISQRLEDADLETRSMELLEETKDFERRYRDAMKEIIDWEKLFFRLEGILLVWGTIQWGWGDKIFF